MVSVSMCVGVLYACSCSDYMLSVSVYTIILCRLIHACLLYIYLGLQEIMQARQEDARIRVESHNSDHSPKSSSFGHCTNRTFCTTTTTTTTATSSAVVGDQAKTDDCCDCSCWRTSSSSSSHTPTHPLNTHTDFTNSTSNNSSNDDSDKCIYHPSIEVYSKLVHEYHLQLSLPPVVFKSLGDLLAGGLDTY